MSGMAAVFRSAARRALRPTSTTRSRRTLVANNEPQPLSPITPRRHYSAGGVNMEEGLNSRPAKTVVPKDVLGEDQAARHVFMTVDEFSQAFETRNLLMRQLVEEKLKYDRLKRRLKRVLVRVPIFIGIAFLAKKYFSGAGDEEAKNTTMTESG